MRCAWVIQDSGAAFPRNERFLSQDLALLQIIMKLIDESKGENLCHRLTEPLPLFFTHEKFQPKVALHDLGMRKTSGIEVFGGRHVSAAAVNEIQLISARSGSSPSEADWVPRFAILKGETCRHGMYHAKAVANLPYAIVLDIASGDFKALTAFETSTLRLLCDAYDLLHQQTTGPGETSRELFVNLGARAAIAEISAQINGLSTLESLSGVVGNYLGELAKRSGRWQRSRVSEISTTPGLREDHKALADAIGHSDLPDASFHDIDHKEPADLDHRFRVRLVFDQTTGVRVEATLIEAETFGFNDAHDGFPIENLVRDSIDHARSVRDPSPDPIEFAGGAFLPDHDARKGLLDEMGVSPSNGEDNINLAARSDVSGAAAEEEVIKEIDQQRTAEITESSSDDQPLANVPRSEPIPPSIPLSQSSAVLEAKTKLFLALYADAGENVDIKGLLRRNPDPVEYGLQLLSALPQREKIFSFEGTENVNPDQLVACRIFKIKRFEAGEFLLSILFEEEGHKWVYHGYLSESAEVVRRIDSAHYNRFTPPNASLSHQNDSKEARQQPTAEVLDGGKVRRPPRGNKHESAQQYLEPPKNDSTSHKLPVKLLAKLESACKSASQHLARFPDNTVAPAVFSDAVRWVVALHRHLTEGGFAYHNLAEHHSLIQFASSYSDFFMQGAILNSRPPCPEGWIEIVHDQLKVDAALTLRLWRDLLKALEDSPKEDKFKTEDISAAFISSDPYTKELLTQERLKSLQRHLQSAQKRRSEDDKGLRLETLGEMISALHQARSVHTEFKNWETVEALMLRVQSYALENGEGSLREIRLDYAKTEVTDLDVVP